MSESGSGRTALVTGGAVGIGKGIALALASRGYDLAISHFAEDAQSRVLADTVASRFGRRCRVYQSDLTDAEAPALLVERAIREMGRLDVLVNNAGLTAIGSVTELDAAELDHLVHLNFRAPLLAIRAAANHMIDRRIRGSIVNITSTRAERAYPGDSLYGATKAALTRASQSAALDLAPYGIRVNCVAPGAIASREGAGAEKHYEALGRKIPLSRTGTTADIGEAVAWLVSEQASYVTGTTLKVDGGLILPGMPEDVSPEAGYGWGKPPAELDRKGKHP
ncbi:SDR family NAD(P)-dependent oxidoreductase [Paenibacillus flagellatus]|uniref:Short-chain dehydrogenase n=1 Tax=Paenibacillus flagellatus TaxID=2211139 RepID=A0A2V5K7V3_9BACL|nr:SDR family NAD(P)-dependent oxidoreductase [Paenibacillus flagellatus]PYI55549.1 short-chain dehydrogenase [Paenibacillus flagellatus]